MLTQCPSCSTLFRVTAPILKMGHGQVRCGKCRTQFDALESLQEEDLDKEAAAIAVNESPPNTLVTEELEREAAASSEKIEYPPDDGNAEADAALEDELEIELSADGEVTFIEENTVTGIETSSQSEESYDEGDDQFDQEVDAASDHETPEYIAEYLVEEQFEGEAPIDTLLSDSHHSDAVIESTQSFAERAPSLPKRRGWLRRSGHHRELQIADELAALTGGAPSHAAKTRGWVVVAAALLLVGLAQIVHHHRDDLVRNTQLGSMVTRFYHALGLTLTPRWDLNAYELQQWGVVSDPKAPDTLRVRASVTNRAPFSQPYPLIRLELQDQWGAPVAARVFNSEEYLPEKSNANRLLAPKQRANAEIAISDPGADAVGFQIRACMQHEQGLSCSDE